MFRLLGFDVRVRPGFLIFMVLIVGLHGNGFGLWLAGSIAAFTLIHEFGHAVVARHNGAKAQIALDFFVGFTSFVPHAPLSKPQRALISFAGPGVHIASSVALLAAMGVNPLDGNSYNRSDWAAAIWWAGPVIGFLNLIPVLPLDGGHIAQTGIEVVFGSRAERAMIIASLVITGAVAVWCFADEERRGFAIFIAFLLFAQFQMLSATNVSRPTTFDRRRGRCRAVGVAHRPLGHAAARPGALALVPCPPGGQGRSARRSPSMLVTDFTSPRTASLVATRCRHAGAAQAARAAAPASAPDRHTR